MAQSAVADKWKDHLTNTNVLRKHSDVIHLYDEWSYDYDESQRAWVCDAPVRCAELMRQYTLDEALCDGIKVLDVGSGTGLVAEALIKCLDSPYVIDTEIHSMYSKLPVCRF